MKKKLCVVMMGLCFLVLLGTATRADLVARYTFDDGTAIDDSGNGLNGTLQGTAAIVNDAERGNVLQLNGALTDYVLISDTGGLLNFGASGPNQGSATVAVWVKSGVAGDWVTQSTVFSQGEWDCGASLTLKGDTSPDGQIWINGNDAHATGQVLRSDVAPATTGWQHVAVTFAYNGTSTTVSMYINGVKTGVAEGPTNGVLPFRLSAPNSGRSRIGLEDRNGSSPRWPFNGFVDDLQIFNAALTEAEIINVMTGTGVTNIDPPAGAKFVPINKVLSWDPPAEFEPNYVFSGYDVYFDVNDVKVKNGDLSVKRVSNNIAETYDPSPTGDLLNSTKYFWRVDVVGQYDYASEPNILEGAVFSFTTVSLEPTITGQPLNQVRGALNGKADAVLSVVAVNATDYQWYKEAGTTDIALVDAGNIIGATTSTLTIAGVGLSDEGQYYCAVSNDDSPTIINSNTVWVEFARQTSDWSFENDYVDTIGAFNGSVADANSTPTFVTDSKDGTYALSLDGTDDRLILPATALSKAGTEMTFSFWTKNNTPAAASTTMYGYADARKNYRLINIHTPWTNNTAYLDVANSDVPGTGDYDRVGAGTAVAAGDPYWIHWIFTKDQEGDRMRVYRNGKQIGSSTENDWRYYGADNLMLGASWTYDTTTQVYSLHQFYNGVIDDLRFYNYYMDEVEAAYLYYDANGQTETVCINENDAIVAAYDFNDNCKIDLPDLAELAVNWLHCKQVPACVDRP